MYLYCIYNMYKYVLFCYLTTLICPYIIYICKEMREEPFLNVFFSFYMILKATYVLLDFKLFSSNNRMISSK